MKIYNVGWSQFFPNTDLKSGREYVYDGKVLDINQDAKTIKATVRERGNTYKVFFAIHNGDEIHKMSCTCPSFESKRYCKHCAAVLWKLDPLSDEECVQNNFFDQSGSVKCTLPKSASPKEKLEDIVEQLKAKYQKKKIYSLWIIERENSEFKSSTVNSWSKTVMGLSLSEYLLSIGVLSPMVNFEITEDDVDLADIKGKRCCSISASGGTDIWIDELLKKLGAKLVFPTDPDLEYVVTNGYIITKEPEDNNRHSFFLLSQKEAGKAKFKLLSGEFLRKSREYVEAMETEQKQLSLNAVNAEKIEQLPKASDFGDLMYFPEKKKDRTVAVDISGKTIAVINDISYGEKRGERNELPKLEKKKSYVSIEKLSAAIKDLLELDYSAISIPSNYGDLQVEDIKLAEEDIERFSKVCRLCQSPAVMKLISFALKRNKDGSLKKRAVTPIIQTKYIPLDFKEYSFSPNFDFTYYELVAKNMDEKVILQIRKKEIVNQREEDIYNPVEISKVSSELIEKILQIGEMIDTNNISITSNDDVKTQNTKNSNQNDFEKAKSLCGTIRDNLIKELQAEDYTYPETKDSFSVSGIFIKEPDFDVLLDICKYYFSTESTDYDGNWGIEDLCEFLEKELNKYHKGSRYSISISFGGLSPAVVVLSFLDSYSKITDLKARFTHNKWEVRGDEKYRKHVEINLCNGNFVVGNFGDNNHGNCERWDYIPSNYTVADIPNSPYKRLLAYEQIPQDMDALVLPQAIYELKRDVFKGVEFKNIFFDVHKYNIESGAFSECKLLESIDWPNTLYICENMFKNCINLTKVTIPEGVFGIEKGAFAGCKNLVKINIPSTIAFIEEGAFDGCDALSSNNPEVWNQICSTNKSKAKFLDDIESYKQYIVNNGYATFEDIYYGFQYIIDTMNACKLWHKLYDSYIGNLDKLNVGNYKYVLYATKNQLAKIETNYNAKIAEFGWKKTRDVSDTTDYLIVDTEDIPRFTTFIAKQHRLSEGDEQGASKFGTTPMEKAIELIETGRSIKIITLKNFCEMLNRGAVGTEVFISRTAPLNSSDVKITKEEKEVPKSIKQESKANIEGSIPISEDFVVFRGILKQYTGKDSEVVIPEKATKIAEEAFKDYKKLKTITLHDGIVKIEKGVFMGCTSLQSIVIPDGVAKIDWGTFINCSSLKSVTIGKGVTHISFQSFKNCKSLKNLFIPETVLYIAPGAFEDCSSLILSGYADSVAEKYANKYGIKFNSIPSNVKSEIHEKSTASNPENEHEEELRKIREDNERRVREDQERQARIEAEERKKREEEEALRKAREAEQGIALEEAYRKAQEDAARRAAFVAERQAREEEERKKREEIERICREAEERRLREEAERKAQEEAERERKLREEEERKAREEAARKEELRKIQEENERRIREDQERIAREQEAIRKREEEARRAREEAERKAREEAERLEKLKAERRAQKVCHHCGGKFKGLFVKKCSSCGRKKDY